MSEMNNLIGSVIAIINHQDVRYDGILFSIDTESSSIVMRDGMAKLKDYFFNLCI